MIDTADANLTHDSLDQVGETLQMMTRIQNQYRVRRGEPPMALDVAPLLEGIYRRQLAKSWDVLHQPLPVTSRPMIGPALNLTRRIFWLLLHPFLYAQADFNRAVTSLLDSLLDQRARLLSENEALRRRVEHLEGVVLKKENDDNADRLR